MRKLAIPRFIFILQCCWFGYISLFTGVVWADFRFNYNGHTYDVITSVKTWNAALSDANNRTVNGQSGYLLHINDALENQEMVNQLMQNLSTDNLKQTFSFDGGFDLTSLWLGANDLSSEGVWRWQDNNVQFWQGDTTGTAVNDQYSHWGQGEEGNEPNNYAGEDVRGQNVAVIRLSTWIFGQIGQWDDVSILNELFYVIEYNAEPVVVAEGFSHIEGNIYNACTGELLPSVDVLFNQDRIQQSNPAGRYNLRLENGNYDISVALNGFITDNRNLTIESRTYYADFPLVPEGGCQAVGRASSFKAVIVAGGGPFIGSQVNHIWDSTQDLTDKAYQSLRLQGFGKNNIYYLSAGNTPRDADGDGENDIKGLATLQNIESVLTEWAGGVEDVVIYFISHGSQKKLHIDRNEVLDAEQLKVWLDNLQSQITGKLSIVIDACFAGSFIPTLAENDRYVMASTGDDTLAVISNKKGSTSFSYYFWDEVVFTGRLGDAFKNARQAMSAQLVGSGGVTQKAVLDTDGDRAETSADYQQIQQYCYGLCNTKASLPPEIISVAPQGNLNGELIVRLNASAADSSSVARAWVTIQRPDYAFPEDNSAINSLLEVELACDGVACSGDYKNFNLNGEYLLSFYVENSEGQVSLPRSVRLLQSGRDEREWAATSLYEPLNGLLTLKDVRVANQHYYVEAQNIGAFSFSISYLQPLFGKALPQQAVFDGEKVVIPSVFAFDIYYAVKLLPNGNAFQLDLSDIQIISE